MITQEKIIETALKLFTVHGVKTVTIDKIVKTLHTSKRTIYNHFKDKTELLTVCLEIYQERVKAENEDIIRNSPNSITAMGHLLHRILARAQMINPNFYTDVFHYYPGMLENLFEKNGNHAKEQLLFLGKKGIEDGLFREDLDIEVVGTTVLHLLKLFKDNQKFPITRYSKKRLTFGILIPYMRGLCTPKGLEILNKEEELFKVPSAYTDEGIYIKSTAL